MKKIISLILMAVVLVLSASCSSDDSSEVVSTNMWDGIFMWTDEETEEFKIIEAKAVDETTVGFVLESSRITDEFEAGAKSKSGRYLVTNLGSKTVKITLSADMQTITVDDMWTEDINLRDENWTGKYKRLLPEEVIPQFGDKSWNGKYTNEATGLTVSVYGIKDGIALFSYKTEVEGEEVVYRLKCLEPEKGKAVYTEGQRLIILELLSRGSKLKVTDLYMNDSENKGITAVYKRQ